MASFFLYALRALGLTRFAPTAPQWDPPLTSNAEVWPQLGGIVRTEKTLCEGKVGAAVTSAGNLKPLGSIMGIRPSPTEQIRHYKLSLALARPKESCA
jgi:hypothetical protein